ncbi:hypothetical protein [Hymenobacter edaphi]|uniref:hypothetical protein n=1 Tax=Hymenobacter edaphi TaxID=2211146 RepID=UPI001057DE2C|nr:hypothetical protein [Hymenobacter edaphi]
MKKHLRPLLLFAAILASVSAQAQQKSAPVNSILKEVTEALQEIQLQESFPVPKKVSVTLETENTRENGAGVQILLFKFGRKWSKAESSEVTYTFALNHKSALTPTPVKDALVKAIMNSYKELSAIDNKTVTSTGFKVKVSFTIEKTTDAGAEYELSPVTPSLSKTWKKKAVHSIEVEFEAPTRAG